MWSNVTQNGDLVMERLDCAFVNEVFLLTFPSAHTHVLPIVKSDHRLLVLYFSLLLKRWCGSLHFKQKWLLEDDYFFTIKKSWSTTFCGSFTWNFFTKARSMLAGLEVLEQRTSWEPYKEDLFSSSRIIKVRTKLFISLLFVGEVLHFRSYMSFGVNKKFLGLAITVN